MTIARGNALDRATDEARRMIHERLRSLGMPDAINGLRADPGSDGTVLVYRTRTIAGSETSEPVNLPVEADPARPLGAFALREITMLIERHARRTMRLRALRSAGQDGAEPTWSFTMHRMMRGFLMARGIDPAMAVARPDMDKAGRDNLDFVMRYLGQQASVSIGRNLQEDGRLDFDSLLDDGIQIIGKGRPAILIEGSFPETVAASLPGRLVSEVVDHPAVRRAGPVRIEDADFSSGLLTIVMTDVQDFVRRPPKGFDRTWSRMRFTGRPME